MQTHDKKFTNWLQLRLSGSSDLTSEKLRELDAHLMTCPYCTYVYITWLRGQQPALAAQMLSRLEMQLCLANILPFLRELAYTKIRGEPFSEFQRMLWRFLERDDEVKACYRVIEADVWFS